VGLPYIIGGAGNCHVYVDASADLDAATAIVVNGKTQRPSVCNATESLLVHASVAHAFLPAVASALGDVEIRGDLKVCETLGERARAATEADWGRRGRGRPAASVATSRRAHDRGSVWAVAASCSRRHATGLFASGEMRTMTS
jgi:acyl-CoA reductase-like NAD-dependent aldehyde dehydrogenase